MRTKLLTMLATLLLLVSTAGAQQAAQPTLKVGDKAPPLGKGEWVKGEPVSEFESGKVYVIENWATWCGPCIAMIPHVTELQKKYADEGLVVIGQNMWEDNPDRVKPFVDSMGSRMDYRVVMDEPSGHGGEMARTWMAAAGQQGIPAAFVVDKEGKIAWIGHPMWIEPVIEKVLADEFDPEAYAPIQAEREAKFSELGQKLGQAAQAGKPDEAVQAADEMIEMVPALRSQLTVAKFQILGQAGRWDDAYAVIEKAIPEMTDPSALNQVAWMIVDPESQLEKKNLDVAMKAAEKANKLAGEKDGPIMDTLARAHFLKGDHAKAIELQKKAISLTDDAEMKEQLEKTLAEYEKAVPKEQ